MDNLAHAGGAVVSFDNEELILVDDQDRELGHMSKDKCHNGDGILHRAFSLFIFNADGQVLLQQRSAQKRLWPLYWSNSCCSHPRRGESMEAAINRRLQQELSMRSELQFLYKFTYQAAYQGLGAEYELCWVFAGRSDDRVQANDNEIADWRFIGIDALEHEMTTHPEKFTPWMKLEWEQIRKDFGATVDAMVAR